MLAPGRSAPIFDAHAHLQLAMSSAPAALESLGPRDRVALMSVDEDCWPRIETLKSASGGVVCAYGVHPWSAHRVRRDGWLADLRQRLEADPCAIVGEIGLDKAWVPPDTALHDWEAQCRVFDTQLDLATEMGRPVSLHCVRCTGFMHDKFMRAETLPKRIYIHSYTGSSAMVRSFSRMKRFGDSFYFGFSTFVNARNKKTPEVIAACPAGRILLESDLEDPSSREQDLILMAEMIAGARGWSLDETLHRTWENANSFYSNE